MLLVIYSPKILSPNSEKYLESYNSDPPVVIRFLTYFHLLGSRIQGSVYSYFECGRRIPDIDTLLMFAEYYKVSLDELVVGSSTEIDTSVKDTSAYDLGIALVRHLQSKHIPIENIMKLSKADFDFLTDYKKLTAENQAELNYLMNYKIRKQSE